MSDKPAPPTPERAPPSLRAQLESTAGVELTAFAPSKDQKYAKARLYQRIQERGGTTELDTLTVDELAALACTRRILTWLRDPAFVAWLGDKDAFATRSLVMRERALDILEDILNSDYEPRILTAKDKLKAADMLLTLTGAYPAKQREIRYLDKDLDAMSPDEVQRQLADTRAKLRELPDS